RTLVSITVVGEPGVGLLQQLQRELWKLHPRRTDYGVVSDFEREPPDWKQVRRRREPQIDILGAFDRRCFAAVDRPPFSLTPDVEIGALLSHRRLHVAPQRVPHHVTL